MIKNKLKTFKLFLEEKRLERKRKIGKTTQDSLYIHKDYAKKVFGSNDDFKKAIDIVEKEKFNYTIVKYNRITNSYSFIYSPDFDSADEPIVGNSINIKEDGTTTKTKALADPWIYHHKWQFVGDDYSGFNVNDSKARSDFYLSIIDEIEKKEDKNVKKKMGKKSYWDSVVLPKIENKEQEIKIANLTSRGRGAIGFKSLVMKYIETNFSDNKNISILDFGAGKSIVQTEKLRESGFTNVTAYDFGQNVTEKHDKNALSKTYNCVFASNVLNVQSSLDMLNNTLNKIAKAVKPGGWFIGNVPLSPRKMTTPIIIDDNEINLNDYIYEELVKLFGDSVKIYKSIGEEFTLITKDKMRKNTAPLFVVSKSKKK